MHHRRVGGLGEGRGAPGLVILTLVLVDWLLWLWVAAGVVGKPLLAATAAAAGVVDIRVPHVIPVEIGLRGGTVHVELLAPLLVVPGERAGGTDLPEVTLVLWLLLLHDVGRGFGPGGASLTWRGLLTVGHGGRGGGLLVVVGVVRIPSQLLLRPRSCKHKTTVNILISYRLFLQAQSNSQYSNII